MNLRYKIEVATTAQTEAEQYRAFIRKRSHDGIPAAAWWDSLMAALHSLEMLPSRCPHIPEQRHFAAPFYHLLYESHRIIFTIEGDMVQVARIYHSASRPLKTLNQRPRHKTPRQT